MSKKAFYISMLFFVILEAYGIYHYDLRTQWETCQDTVWSSMQHFWMPTPMYRYAHILNKVFFVLSFPLHVPLKGIAILSNINDMLFYLLVAFLIIRYTHRYDYAATVLAAPVFLHLFGYYDIINETFPGGSMLILFVALHKYMQDGLLKKILLVVSMFFVVWGHPDMLLTLGVFLPFIYSDFQSVKANWKMVVFILVNVAVRSLLLADYDMGKINLVNIHSFFIHNLPHKAWAYLVEDWFIAIVVACMLYVIYRSKNKMQFAGLLLTPVMLAYVDAYHVSLHISIWDPNVMKYLYPVHLFALLQSMIFIHSLPAPKLRWSIAVLLLILVAGITQTLSHRDLMAQRALTMKKLNAFCAQQDPSHSKWYIRLSTTPGFANQTLDLSNECLVFSARDHQVPNIHLVMATEELLPKLDTVGEDKLLANGVTEFPISSLDTFYFHVHPGRYNQLLLDSAQLNMLQPL
jgi:hypothetical protein